MTNSESGMPLVLMYHSVDRYRTDPYQITVRPDRFDQQMCWLWQHGLRGVSMRQLLAAHRQGVAAGLVGLTFDDGYADFLEHVPRTLSSPSRAGSAAPTNGMPTARERSS